MNCKFCILIFIIVSCFYNNTLLAQSKLAKWIEAPSDIKAKMPTDTISNKVTFKNAIYKYYVVYSAKEMLPYSIGLDLVSGEQIKGDDNQSIMMSPVEYFKAISECIKQSNGQGCIRSVTDKAMVDCLDIGGCSHCWMTPACR